MNEQRHDELLKQCPQIINDVEACPDNKTTCKATFEVCT